MATDKRPVIVARFNARKVLDKLKTSHDDMIDRITMYLMAVGEECIKIAREKGNYNDITGNLRSSIGYVVLVDGKVIQQTMSQRTNVAPGFQTVMRKRPDGSEYVTQQKIGGDGSEGESQGLALLDRLKTEYPSGCVLIVCAGMNYAAYVENIHGKRVLVDAKLAAEKLIDDFIRKLSA